MEDVFSDDFGGCLLYADILDKLSGMVEMAERETSERRESLSTVMEYLFGVYYVPEIELDVRRSVTGAFQEYNYSVELLCRKLSYIHTACLYYGIWIVREIPLDKIIAAKIKELLDADVDTYDDSMPVFRIPGFNLCWDGGKVYQDLDPEEEQETWEDYESIMEGIDEVSEYILRHPHQVDVQCLMSVMTGTEGLADVATRAAALDEAIDRYTITDECRDLDSISWGKLFDGWVRVKAFSHVTDCILRFVDEYKESTVGEATRALESLLPNISYASVERNVRIALRQSILESGIYEFELSKVQLGEAVKKASQGFKCLRFMDAKQSVKEELISMIRNDKRLIPLPLDYSPRESVKRHSLICLKGNEIKGAFFATEYDGSLVLFLAYVTENTAMAALLTKAYEMAVNEYGPHKKVIIPVINDRTAMLIENLVPGVTRERLVRVQKK